LRKGTERGAEQKLEGLGCAIVSVIPFTDEDNEEEEEGVFILARKVIFPAAWRLAFLN